MSTNKIIRYLVIIFLLLSAAVSASAQKTVTFADGLGSADALSGGRIKIGYAGNASEALKNLDSKRAIQKINGYRVRIFFDNSQYARDKAFATRARFSELFPDVPVNMSYENPYFKVTVGNCLTNEEAIILWGRVKNSFNTAFVVVEEMDLSVFGE